MAVGNDYEFTSIDDELLLAGRDAYMDRPAGGETSSVFWDMKAN